MAILMFKFVALAIRQITKPVSRLMFTHAANHPHIRGMYVIVGQRYHFWMARLQGQAKPLSLSEQTAIQVGTETLVEVTVFLVAAAIIGFDSRRSSIKEKHKQAQLESRLQGLEEALERCEEQMQKPSSVVETRLAALQLQLDRMGATKTK
eukprot:NODE_6519_length_527_cov_25.832500_g6354_i0.p1 GENE.NODE_6519_length_527_cov_25.832500_g6354_i0~~NODE_6519_length_527_cov_25.832500_g6354_i0.p1  ORF type:complete len:168 (-),score=32.98 NODE_6519_length_527_cov_25.832500_g6354_i0:23-475(-)